MADIDPKAIAAFVAIGLLSPLLHYWAQRLIDSHRTRKAIEFLEADELVFEGARFRKLLTGDGAQLLGPGRVVSIGRDRVLVASSDGAVQVPFDGVEFKAAYPHWLAANPDSGPGGAAGPGPALPPRPGGYS